MKRLWAAQDAAEQRERAEAHAEALQKEGMANGTLQDYRGIVASKGIANLREFEYPAFVQLYQELGLARKRSSA